MPMRSTNKHQLRPSPVRRVFTFINEARWVGWTLPLIGVLIVISYYGLASHADQPEIHITEAYAGKESSASSGTIFVAKYKNDGNRAAARITVKLGAIDPSMKKSKILAPSEKLERLRAGPLFRTAAFEFKIHQQDTLDLFAICLYYSDDSGKTFEPVANFYKASPMPVSSSDGHCCELADATVAEEKALSSWFSCAKL
jgi:hypothetical protein